MLLSYGISDRGLVRQMNEDSIFVSEAPFFVLADGMGGYEGGQIASSLAVKTVQDALSVKSGEPYTETALRDAVLTANRALLWEKARSSQLVNMGTTLVLAAVSGNVLTWAHVGDSRLYLLENGRLRQVTTDHSFVMTLLQEGKITQEEMRGHPRKNEITRAVGIGSELSVDTGRVALTTPCLILLCSDGLSSTLSDETIKETLLSCGRTREELAACAQKLLKQVYAEGAEDNVSIILVYVEP